MIKENKDNNNISSSSKHVSQTEFINSFYKATSTLKTVSEDRIKTNPVGGTFTKYQFNEDSIKDIKDSISLVSLYDYCTEASKLQSNSDTVKINGIEFNKEKLMLKSNKWDQDFYIPYYYYYLAHLYPKDRIEMLPNDLYNKYSKFLKGSIEFGPSPPDIIVLFDLAGRLPDEITKIMVKGRKMTKKDIYIYIIDIHPAIPLSYLFLSDRLTTNEETVTLLDGRTMNRQQLLLHEIHINSTCKESLRNLINTLKSQDEKIKLLDGTILTRLRLINKLNDTI